MTEHDDAPTADQAEGPLSDDELDAIAGGIEERCGFCNAVLGDSADHTDSCPLGSNNLKGPQRYSARVP